MKIISFNVNGIRAVIKKGFYNFEFDEDDIMRSELVKFLVKKFQDIE